MPCQVAPDTLCFGRYAPAPQGSYSPSAMTPEQAKEALEVGGWLLVVVGCGRAYPCWWLAMASLPAACPQHFRICQ